MMRSDIWNTLGAAALLLVLAGCGTKAGDDANGNATAATPVLPAEDRTAAAPPVDLNGVWHADGNGRLAPAAAPAFTPSGERAYAAAKAAFAAGGDPLARCLPPGIPRAVAMGKPFEISDNADLVTMSFQAQRLIRFVDLTGRYATNSDTTFMGQAKGRWDGKALVIDSSGFKTGTALDGSGLPHGAKLAVLERIELTGPNSAVDHVTITDPEMYAKPWTADIRLTRTPGADIAEDVCVERTGIHP